MYSYPQPKLDQEELHKLIHQYTHHYPKVNDSTKSHDNSNSNSNMSTKHHLLTGINVVITGPTSGIGMELAKILYELGATIIAVGRSSQRLANLQSELELVEKQQQQNNKVNKKTTKVKRFHFYTADFDDLDKVHSVCKRIQTDFSKSHIDFLINNAGLPNVSDENGEILRTKQNYELVFGVNYLSHYVLTSQLLPLLEQSPHFPRIVYIASNFHRGVTGDALLCYKSTSSSLSTNHPISSGKNPLKIPEPKYAYANSKFAQLLHVRSINRLQKEKLEAYRLSSSKDKPKRNTVHAVAVCPGGVRTSIHKGHKNIIGSFCFPVNVSTQCIFYAMFSPLDVTTNDSFRHFKHTSIIDYVKNIPTLFFMNPPSFLSEKLRLKYLFVFAILSMPFQKFQFSYDLYAEESDERTYEQNRQQNLESWSRLALARWL